MITLGLDTSAPQIRRVLAIGCHADDIEIGCGGTILELTHRLPSLHVTWLVLAAHGTRVEEATASAEAFLRAASTSDVHILSHRESFLPFVGEAVKETFEDFKSVQPDLVLTHARDDLHQDHRLACDLTWNTFRSHLIFEYEIPKYDGDFVARNVFVPLQDATVDRKLQLIAEHFTSQAKKHWFDEDVFRGMLRLRGVECATRYAEAFTCRKLSVWAPKQAEAT